MGRSTSQERIVEREAQVPEVHARSRRPSWCSRRCAARSRWRSSAASTRSPRACCASGASSSSPPAPSGCQGRPGAHRGRRAAPPGRAGSSGRWGARRWRWRSRGNSCGAGSEHARRPVPRAGRARPPRRARRPRRGDQPPGDLPPPGAAAEGPAAAADARPIEACSASRGRTRPTAPGWSPRSPRRELGRRGQSQAGAAADARARGCCSPQRSRAAGGGRGSSGSRGPIELWHLDMTVGLGRRARLVLSERRDRLLHARDHRLGARRPLPRRRRRPRSSTPRSPSAASGRAS